MATIAIDLDGTLADHRPDILAYYNKHEKAHEHAPFNQKEYDAHQWHWFRETCKVCFYKVMTSQQLMLDEKMYPHAAATIKAWNKAGHTQYIISKRNQIVEEASNTWLAWHDIHPCFKDVIIMGAGVDKSVKVNELGITVMVDDTPSVFKDLKESSPKCLRVAMAQTYNEDADVHYRCNSWKEIEDVVT